MIATMEYGIGLAVSALIFYLGRSVWLAVTPKCSCGSPYVKIQRVGHERMRVCKRGHGERV